MSAPPLSAAGVFLRKSYFSFPIGTRLICSLLTLTLIPTFFPLDWINHQLVQVTAQCVAQIREAPYPIMELYRFIMAPFIHIDFLSGLLSIFAFLQIGQRIEYQKGSIAFMQIVAITILLIQAIHMFSISYALTTPWLHDSLLSHNLNIDAPSYSSNLRIPVWGAHPRTLIGQSQFTWRSLSSFSIPTQACSCNNWGIIFALIVYECQALTRDWKRHVFMIPFAVPTRLIPALFLLFYQLWFGVQVHTIIGFIVGYIITFVPFMILPQWLLRVFELSICRSSSSFVSVDRAGKMQPYREFIREESEAAIVVNQSSTSGNGIKSINGTTNLNRSAFPVNRVVRTPSADQWRRVDVSSSSSSSNSSSSTSSSDGDEIPTGGTHHNGVRPYSPAVSHRPLSLHDHTHIDEEDIDDARSVTGSTQSAILAANVARILEPAYPMSPEPITADSSINTTQG